MKCLWSFLLALTAVCANNVVAQHSGSRVHSVKHPVYLPDTTRTAGLKQSVAPVMSPGNGRAELETGYGRPGAV